jgi:acyl carrier protein
MPKRHMTDVFARISDILVFALMADERQVSECSRLVEDLGADSIDLYEFAAACEHEFTIEIPGCALEKFLTVGDAVRFVEFQIRELSKANLSFVADSISCMHPILRLRWPSSHQVWTSRLDARPTF